MKAIYVLGSLTLDSPALQAFYAITALKKEGIHPIIVSIGEDGPIGTWFTKQNIPLIHIRLKNWVRERVGFVQLKKICAIEKPDFFHFYTDHPRAIRFLSLCFPQTPIIHSPSSLSFFSPHTKIIANSHALGHAYAHKFRMPVSQIEVVTPGIDLTQFQTISLERTEQIKEQFLIPEHAEVFMSVGPLNASKRFSALIEGFFDFLKIQPQSALVLVGMGEESGRLKQQVSELGVSHRIIFTDFYGAIAEILQICDVYVQSTFSLSVSQTMLEAMAARKPVLVPFTEGTSECIHQGKNGWMFPGMTKNHITDGLLRMSQFSRAERTKMGWAARASIERHFKELDFTKQMLRVYKKITQKEGAK